MAYKHQFILPFYACHTSIFMASKHAFWMHCVRCIRDHLHGEYGCGRVAHTKSIAARYIHLLAACVSLISVFSNLILILATMRAYLHFDIS